MRASAIVGTGSDQNDQSKVRGSKGRRFVALLRRALSGVFLVASVLSLLVGAFALVAGYSGGWPSFPIQPMTAWIVFAFYAALGAVLWSVGRVLADKADDWADFWLSYCYFETKARGSRKWSWLLVWLAALLDGFLLVPRTIGRLGFAAYVLITGAAVVAITIILALVPIVVVGFIFWWVGCQFFITCS